MGNRRWAGGRPLLDHGTVPSSWRYELRRPFQLHFQHCSRGILGGAEGEIEGGPLIEGRFNPNPTAVAGDNPLGNGQADARALEGIGLMETLEDAEKSVSVGHIETDAVVADEEDDAVAAAKGADFDDGLRTRAAELDCIGEETGEELFEEFGIALDGWQWMDAPFDGAFCRVGFEASQHRLNEWSQRRGLEFEFVPGEPGEF